MVSFQVHSQSVTAAFKIVALNNGLLLSRRAAARHRNLGVTRLLLAGHAPLNRDTSQRLQQAEQRSFSQSSAVHRLADDVRQNKCLVPRTCQLCSTKT